MYEKYRKKFLINSSVKGNLYLEVFEILQLVNCVSDDDLSASSNFNLEKVWESKWKWKCYERINFN